jgi:opacity protein-like surface antigen
MDQLRQILRLIRRLARISMEAPTMSMKMLRNMWLPATMAMCTLAIGAPAALAQEGQGTDPRASFFAGASLLGGAKTFFIGPQGLTTQFQNGGRLGFRGSVNIHEHWGVEGTYGFESDGLQVTHTTPIQRVANFGVHIHQVEVNGLYYFDSRGHRFRPFVTAGIGFMRYNPTSDAKAAAAVNFLDQPTLLRGETHPDFVPGVGVEAMIVQHIGARFDFRDHITGLPRFGLPQDALGPNGPHYPISGLVSNWELTGGVVYHFR